MEEVIDTGISAGNAPDLAFNAAPAAEPQFLKQGGLVPLDDCPGAKTHIEEFSGALADDGVSCQMPWKSNPVMISDNKKVFEQPTSTRRTRR